jgi:hemin uptake protein HemP
MSSQAPQTPAPGIERPRAIPRVASERLMAGTREIIIQHGTEEYRLRITGAGKLILTK